VQGHELSACGSKRFHGPSSPRRQIIAQRHPKVDALTDGHTVAIEFIERARNCDAIGDARPHELDAAVFLAWRNDERTIEVRFPQRLAQNTNNVFACEQCSELITDRI
jgi:hypothetical protein